VEEYLDYAARARERVEATNHLRPSARNADESLLVVESREENVGRLVAHVNGARDVARREIDDAHGVREPVDDPRLTVVPSGDAHRLHADGNLCGQDGRA